MCKEFGLFRFRISFCKDDCVVCSLSCLKGLLQRRVGWSGRWVCILLLLCAGVTAFLGHASAFVNLVLGRGLHFTLRFNRRSMVLSSVCTSDGASNARGGGELAPSSRMFGVKSRRCMHVDSSSWFCSGWRFLLGTNLSMGLFTNAF